MFWNASFKSNDLNTEYISNVKIHCNTPTAFSRKINYCNLLYIYYFLPMLWVFSPFFHILLYIQTDILHSAGQQRKCRKVIVSVKLSDGHKASINRWVSVIALESAEVTKIAVKDTKYFQKKTLFQSSNLPWWLIYFCW